MLRPTQTQPGDDLQRRAELVERLEQIVASGRSVDVAAEARGSGLSPAVVEESLFAIRLLADGGDRAARILSGTRVGPYTILDRVGVGGMAQVFRAWDPTLNKTVALKIAQADLGTPERAIREAQALARLRHPNVVSVLGGGVHEGSIYMAMEYVDGSDLATLLRRTGSFRPCEAARIAMHVAYALQHAHEHGVLHRDVKPANVIVDRAGNPCLADFGIARLQGADDLTKTGSVIGTPAFLAPEQARGERELGPACDVYGLGATLYTLLTGEPPFAALRFDEQLLAVANREPDPPSRRAAVPRALDAICLRALSKEPAARGSMSEFASDLAGFLNEFPGAEEGERPAPSRWGTWALALFALVGWVTAIGLATPRGRPTAAVLPSPTSSQTAAPRPTVAPTPRPSSSSAWSAPVPAAAAPLARVLALVPGVLNGWCLADAAGNVWRVSPSGEVTDRRQYPGRYRLAAGGRGGVWWVLVEAEEPRLVIVRGEQKSKAAIPPDAPGKPAVAVAVALAPSGSFLIATEGRLNQYRIDGQLLRRTLGDRPVTIAWGEKFPVLAMAHTVAALSGKDLNTLGTVRLSERIRSLDLVDLKMVVGSQLGGLALVNAGRLQWSSPAVEARVPINAVAMHPARPLIATGDANGTLSLRDLETGARLGETTMPGAIDVVCWSAQGRLLVVTEGKTLSWVDVQTGVGK